MTAAVAIRIANHMDLINFYRKKKSDLMERSFEKHLLNLLTP